MTGLAEVIEAALASDEAQIIEMIERVSGIGVPERLRGNLVYPAAHIVAAQVTSWLQADEQVEKAARAVATLNAPRALPDNMPDAAAYKAFGRAALAAVAGDDDA
ncbi:MAG: hypothetical protein ACTHJM_12140 [Marmoricola sp.]